MTKEEDLRSDDCDEPDDEPECDRCRGDGRDPWTDYLLPCPFCLGGA